MPELRTLLPAAVSSVSASITMASRASLEYDYLFKIVLVGDAAVGKTNLLACYTSQVREGFRDGVYPLFENPSLICALVVLWKSIACPIAGARLSCTTIPCLPVRALGTTSSKFSCCRNERWIICDGQDKRPRADGTVPSFRSDRKTTVGVEFATMVVTHPDGKRIKAQIWDTGERYVCFGVTHENVSRIKNNKKRLIPSDVPYHARHMPPAVLTAAFSK